MSTSTTLEKKPQRAQNGNGSGSIGAYLSQNLWQYAMMLMLGVIVVAFQVSTNGKLLWPDNVADLVRQNAYVLILAIGMVMIIVAGHIDLSVGSVVAFLGGCCAIMIDKWDVPWLIAVGITVILGGVVGCWQGFWVAYVGIPAFIVTLGGMLLFRGLATVIVGRTVAASPEGFVSIASGSLPNKLGYLGQLDGTTVLVGALALAGLVVSQIRARRELIRYELRLEPFAAFVGKLVVFGALISYITYLLAKSTDGTPNVLIIIGVLVIIYTFVMGNTVFGRNIYAMGGNLSSAKLSGVKTHRVNFMLFVNMGMLAGVAAVITTSRLGSATAQAGNNFELDAIAAAFIGGTAVTGGVGKVSGAVIGALIMGVLNMGLSIMGVDDSWKQAIKGLVLVLAVAFDVVYKRIARGA